MAENEDDLLADLTEFVANIDAAVLPEDQKAARKSLLSRASEIFDLNLSDEEDGGGENQDYPSDDGGDENDSSTDENDEQSSEPTFPVEQPVSTTKAKHSTQKSKESPVNAALVEEDEDDETMDGYKIGSSDDETYSFDSKRRTVGIQKSFSESKSEYKDVVLFAKHYGTLFKKRKGALLKKVDKLDALACAGQLMLYKDQILIQVIKKQDEMERAEVIKDPKSDLNILLELSGKNYEFKVPEKDQREKWIVALNSCFNCLCKRTDLMCKGNCDEKLTGFMEEYDPLELDEDDQEEENVYDDLEGEDDSSKGPKGKVSDFESRWEKRVRLIPEALDSTYVYYDPHEEENRRLLNTKQQPKTQQAMNIPPQSVSSASPSPASSSPSSPTKSNLKPSQSEDSYTDDAETSSNYTDDPDETDEDSSDEYDDEDQEPEKDIGQELNSKPVMGKIPAPPPLPKDKKPPPPQEPRVEATKTFGTAKYLEQLASQPIVSPKPTQPKPPVVSRPPVGPKPPAYNNPQDEIAAKLAKMKKRGEGNPTPSNTPSFQRPLPPKPNAQESAPKNFGNNNGPTKPNQLPIIPHKKESVVDNNPNRPVQPAPKPGISAVQQRILDAQARAKEQNATSPPPIPGPKIQRKPAQFGSASTNPNISQGPRPAGPKRPIVRRPLPGGPQNPMEELSMKLAQRKNSGL